ncbi:hypothetical protein [Psychrobacter piscatorii]|uniref:Uncharacterized protein n=1 Tax=Psychrobacter piscatorii TaxID=554343 RepID=A0A0T6DQP6_9GAMM|nr:hypothetical protein [Psychrobacter piscatorii]KRU22024.1 hypothetical protein AS194_10240 [Psychrobacter piscatorii]
MNDEKKDIGTDFDEELSQLVHKKSRKRVKNNIYERFISRVQSAENDTQNDNDDSTSLKTASKLPAFEPLSVEELQLFEDENNDKEPRLEFADIGTTNATFDFSGQNASTQNKVSDTRMDNYASVDHNLNSDLSKNNEEKKPSSVVLDQAMPLSNTTIDDPSDTKSNPLKPDHRDAIKPQKTVVSSKKPLIIGMIFGSLLIAIVVLTLIFTGFLSTSISDTTVSNDSGLNGTAPAATTSTPVVGAEPVVNSDDDPLPNDANTVEEPLVSAQSINADNSEQNVPAAEVEPIEPSPAPESDATITYEDFRQESQTTLYRETND